MKYTLRCKNSKLIKRSYKSNILSGKANNILKSFFKLFKYTSIMNLLNTQYYAFCVSFNILNL